MDRGYQHNLKEKIAIRNKENSQHQGRVEKEMLPSVTQYQPLVSTIKEALRVDFQCRLIFTCVRSQIK